MESDRRDVLREQLADVERTLAGAEAALEDLKAERYGLQLALKRLDLSSERPSPDSRVSADAWTTQTKTRSRASGTSDAVLAALGKAASPLSPTEIADRTGLSHPQVRAALNFLKGKELAFTVARAQWVSGEPQTTEAGPSEENGENSDEPFRLGDQHVGQRVRVVRSGDKIIGRYVNGRSIGLPVADQTEPA